VNVNGFSRCGGLFVGGGRDAVAHGLMIYD
jgi:hypothetical protein